MTLLADGGFLAGLAWGAAALGAAFVLLVVVKKRWGRPELPVVAGLLLVGAGLEALLQVHGAPARLLLGVGALALAGTVIDLGRGRVGSIVGAVVAAVGAGLVVSSPGLADGGWVEPLLAATVLAGGLGVAAFDRRWHRHGLAPVLLALSFLGAYLTLPDTEEAATVLGASLPLALLGWPSPFARVGTGGAMAAAGLLAWTAGVGGVGRPAAVIGAAASLGVFLVEPLAHRIPVGWRAERRGGAAAGLLVVLHVVLVVVAARVAGLRVQAWEAAALALVALAAGLVGAMAVTGHGRNLVAAPTLEDE